MTTRTRRGRSACTGQLLQAGPGFDHEFMTVEHRASGVDKRGTFNPRNGTQRVDARPMRPITPRSHHSHQLLFEVQRIESTHLAQCDTGTVARRAILGGTKEPTIVNKRCPSRASTSDVALHRIGDMGFPRAFQFWGVPDPEVGE